LYSAFVALADQGAHILLMQYVTPESNDQQQQGERQNRDHKKLQAQPAEKWSG
jgi:hypothetical protein